MDAYRATSRIVGVKFFLRRLHASKPQSPHLSYFVFFGNYLLGCWNFVYLIDEKDTANGLLSMGKKGTKYYPLLESPQSSFLFLNLQKDFQFVPSVM